MTIRSSQTYDNLLLLKDAGAVTADGAATVGGQARVLDMGTGRFSAKAIVDSSALDLASADETYRVIIQGSNASNFGSGVVELGSGAVAATGRAEIHVTNEQGGTIYRYVRAYIDVGGTTPSINSTIFLAKH
jgi:hypothetical protein